MIDLKKLIKAQHIFDEDECEWVATIKISDICTTEIGVRGDKSGVFREYLELGEEIIENAQAYVTSALDYLQFFVPNNTKNEYELFSISINDFMYGSCSSKNIYTKGFMITFSLDIGKADTFLYEISFFNQSNSLSKSDFQPIGINIARF